MKATAQPSPDRIRPRTPTELVAAFQRVADFLDDLDATDMADATSAGAIDIRIRANELQNEVDDALFFYGSSIP